MWGHLAFVGVDRGNHLHKIEGGELSGLDFLGFAAVGEGIFRGSNFRLERLG